MADAKTFFSRAPRHINLIMRVALIGAVRKEALIKGPLSAPQLGTRRA